MVNLPFTSGIWCSQDHTVKEIFEAMTEIYSTIVCQTIDMAPEHLPSLHPHSGMICQRISSKVAQMMSSKGD